MSSRSTRTMARSAARKLSRLFAGCLSCSKGTSMFSPYLTRGALPFSLRMSRCQASRHWRWPAAATTRTATSMARFSGDCFLARGTSSSSSSDAAAFSASSSKSSSDSGRLDTSVTACLAAESHMACFLFSDGGNRKYGTSTGVPAASTLAAARRHVSCTISSCVCLGRSGRKARVTASSAARRFSAWFSVLFSAEKWTSIFSPCFKRASAPLRLRGSNCHSCLHMSCPCADVMLTAAARRLAASMPRARASDRKACA
mmetsp:Transcript_1463/g.4424  ORF Transcript_1463/g.4424 Transcript_1463/m.4424 type:complete len:258 (+) Transcript_1463:272-1045(+)